MNCGAPSICTVDKTEASLLQDIEDKRGGGLQVPVSEDLQKQDTAVYQAAEAMTRTDKSGLLNAAHINWVSEHKQTSCAQLKNSQAKTVR